MLIDWSKLSLVLGAEVKNFAALKKYLDGEYSPPIDFQTGNVWRAPKELVVCNIPTLIPSPQSMYQVFDQLITVGAEARRTLLEMLPERLLEQLGLYIVTLEEDRWWPPSEEAWRLIDTAISQLRQDRYDHTTELYQEFDEVVARMNLCTMSTFPDKFTGTKALLVIRLLFIVDTYLYLFGKLTAMTNNNTLPPNTLQPL